jgi:aminomethyltransferase
VFCYSEIVMTEPSSTPAIETPLAQTHASSGAPIGAWFGCSMPDHFGDWLAEYHAARETVALFDKSYRCYLKFTGPDRVRYLNAILTNDIKSLASGHGNVSLFLNPQGRIQAEIETYAGDAALFCVSFAMIRETLVPALDKFIIMDDVTLTDETENWGTLALEGPRAAELTRNLTGVDLSSVGDFEFHAAAIDGHFCGVTRRSPGGIAGADLLAARSDLPKLWSLLRGEVAKAGGSAAGYQALNALRLEQGIPWFSYDFGDKQIPHEAGLQDSHISFTKGCYTGQEIVERVRSRGQVNRVRALLKIDGAEPPPVGASILTDGKEVGHITRSAFSPALQCAIAMAYLRRENAAGSPLLVLHRSASAITPVLASSRSSA